MGDLFSLLLIYIGLLLCIYRSPSTRCPRPSSATTSTRYCAPPTATTSSPARPSCLTCSTTRSSSPSGCTLTSSTRSTFWRTSLSSRRAACNPPCSLRAYTRTRPAATPCTPRPLTPTLVLTLTPNPSPSRSSSSASATAICSTTCTIGGARPSSLATWG